MAKTIGDELEVDLGRHSVIVVEPGQKLPTSVDNAIVGFKGFGVGWDVAKNGRTIQMSRSEFEPDNSGETPLTWQRAYSGPTGNKTNYDWWYTGQLYRPLDMPIQPYNAVMSGCGDRPFVFPFSADFTYTRVKFRVGTPVNPADYDVPPLSSLTRSLYVNKAGGYSGSITSVAFDGGSTSISGHEPEADSLIGRKVKINNTVVEITDNTTTTISFEETDFGTVADNAEIAPADTIEFPMARPYIRLHISGRRALPPKTAPFACIDSAIQTKNLATIAKTYLNARENDGREFIYGANWPYRGSDAVNDADGKALMECDTLALMALIGMDYDDSPYQYETPSLTADFDTVIAAWTATAAANSIPWFQMSSDQTVQLVEQVDGAWINGLGGRIVDQGAMAWWFWDNGYVFRPEIDGKLDLTQLRSGDIVLFRRAGSTYFDNVGHIGVIDVDTDGTIYVIHVTWGPWTCDKVVVRSRLEDEFWEIAPGRYQPEDMYFARIPYGSTGKVDGSYIPDAEEDEEDDE